MGEESVLVGRIDRAVVEAMKARDPLRTSALRMVRAALQNRAIDKRASLDDGDVLQVLGTLAKQRRESIEQFREGGREELADKEESELRILQEFLPDEMGEDEVRRAVEAAVSETGAAGPRDMGKVMAALMGRLKGRADGKLVNRLVRERLAAGGGS
jgi:hypothetical protein